MPTAAWREANKERMRGYRRKWVAANPDKQRAAVKASIAKKPEHYKAMANAWRAANPDKVRAIYARHDAEPHRAVPRGDRAMAGSAY